MNTKTAAIMAASVVAVLGMVAIPGDADAAKANSVTVTPINEDISLEMTTTVMSVPADNKLPWGTVRGAASDVVDWYPVIIQFYKGGEPVHVAQVDTRGDGSYEYRFRVMNTDLATGESVKVFEGDYLVKIHKVIPNTDSRA